MTAPAIRKVPVVFLQYNIRSNTPVAAVRHFKGSARRSTWCCVFYVPTLCTQVQT